MIVSVLLLTRYGSCSPERSGSLAPKSHLIDLCLILYHMASLGSTVLSKKTPLCNGA